MATIAKKVIAGKGACKHPNGRGNPSREFTIDGVGYYFCYGWTDDLGDGIAPQCIDCPAHINAADVVLEQVKADREQRCREIVNGGADNENG